MKSDWFKVGMEVRVGATWQVRKGSFKKSKEIQDVGAAQSIRKEMK